MQQTKELSTKNASQFLNISVSSMRLYAQTMEAMGYEFKKVDNARRFTQYDLQLINDAMERFKLVGGTMKHALHYTIVKYEQGQEVADAIPAPRKEEQKPTDYEALQNNIINQLDERIQQALEHNQNELREMLGQPTDDNQQELEQIKNENEELKSLNDDLRSEVKQLKDEHEDLTEEHEIALNRLGNAREQLNKLQNMSIWDFRKWKKN